MPTNGFDRELFAMRRSSRRIELCHATLNLVRPTQFILVSDTNQLTLFQRWGAGRFGRSSKIAVETVAKLDSLLFISRREE